MVLAAVGLLVPSLLVAQDREILSAEFAQPTQRYAHGVLGDMIEYGQLIIETRDENDNRSTLRVTLPETRVFEDLAPRLWDITGDGAPEIVVVETALDQGAQLAIYDVRGQKIAATRHIGTANRWLAPVGAADLDGDGHIEIAYIDRPHLAKTLRIWRFQPDDFSEITRMGQFANHRIGWDYIVGGLKSCSGKRAALILPTGDWQNIVAVTMVADHLNVAPVSAYSLPRLEQALTCQ